MPSVKSLRAGLGPAASQGARRAYRLYLNRRQAALNSEPIAGLHWSIPVRAFFKNLKSFHFRPILLLFLSKTTFASHRSSTTLAPLSKTTASSQTTFLLPKLPLLHHASQQTRWCRSLPARSGSLTPNCCPGPSSSADAATISSIFYRCCSCSIGPAASSSSAAGTIRRLWALWANG